MHIVEGGVNPCPHCPPIPTQAPMDKEIFVGFGEAVVKRDGVVVADGEKIGNESEWEKFLTFADAEEMANDRIEDAEICQACGQPLGLYGGFAGTGLCGPCATGEAETLDEIGESW